MYQPQIPLIEMSPGFKARRLGEVELGRLVLLRGPAADIGVGLRADTLSARGDLTEGVLRLSGAPVRFERIGLEDSVIAIEIEFVLEADPASASARAPRSGDLIVSASRTATGLMVANLWGAGAGVLDLASAVIRPYAGTHEVTHTVLSWRLVERENRTRVLLDHSAPREPEARLESEEPHFEEAPRRRFAEDSD